MSGRFSFRLQKVLELKEQAEQAAATRLVRVQDGATAAQHAHDELAAVRAEGAAQRASHGSSGATVGQLQNMTVLIAALDERVAQAADDASGARALVDDAQQQLTAAHQARRVLDRLRDRKRGEWQHAESQADLQAMDSLALTRFSKQNPVISDDA